MSHYNRLTCDEAQYALIERDPVNRHQGGHCQDKRRHFVIKSNCSKWHLIGHNFIVSSQLGQIPDTSSNCGPRSWDCVCVWNVVTFVTRFVTLRCDHLEPMTRDMWQLCPPTVPCHHYHHRHDFISSPRSAHYYFQPKHHLEHYCLISALSHRGHEKQELPFTGDVSVFRTDSNVGNSFIFQGLKSLLLRCRSGAAWEAAALSASFVLSS